MFIEDDVIKTVFDSKLTAKFFELKTIYEQNQDPNIKWCQNRDCLKGSHITEIRRNNYQCIYCQMKFCEKCFKL